MSLLVNQTSANASQSFFSTSGGGGGSVPLNLVTSSITTPSPGTEDLTIIGVGGCETTFNMTQTGLNQITLGDGIENGGISMRNGTTVAIGGVAGGAEVQVSISTLICSTINGAAPGGGGSGPNLNVSSISFPLGDETTAGVINMISTLAFNDSNTPVLQDILFLTNFSLEAAILPYVSTTNAIQVNGPGGDAANGELKLIGSADGRSVLASFNGVGALSTLTVLADSVNMPTNLNVSSINGAAPGGGGSVPANLVVSTVSASLQATPDAAHFFSMGVDGGSNSFLTVGGPSTNITYSDTRLLGADGSVQSYIRNQIGPGGAAIQYYDQVTFKGAVSFDSTTSVVSIAPLCSISSLNVSSINGVAPGGGSLYPVVSTFISTGGGSQIQLNTSTGAVVQIGPAISTTIGHNYQITFPIGMTPSSAPVYDDRLTFTYQNDGVGAIAAFQTEPILTGGGVATPYTYKARLGTGGVAFSVEASTSNPVLITLDNLQGITLVDLGPSV